MPRRSLEQIAAHDVEIRKMREQGCQCIEIARALGINEGVVWNSCRRLGIATSNYDRRSTTEDTLLRALTNWDLVSVENGASGGFVVTLDDRYTGKEKDTIASAIRDAARGAGTW